MSKAARRIGAFVQGILLGSLLWLAIVLLASLETGARLFRYQGF